MSVCKKDAGFLGLGLGWVGLFSDAGKVPFPHFSFSTIKRLLLISGIFVEDLKRLICIPNGDLKSFVLLMLDSLKIFRKRINKFLLLFSLLLGRNKRGSQKVLKLNFAGGRDRKRRRGRVRKKALLFSSPLSRRKKTQKMSTDFQVLKSRERCSGGRKDKMEVDKEAVKKSVSWRQLLVGGGEI